MENLKAGLECFYGSNAATYREIPVGETAGFARWTAEGGLSLPEPPLQPYPTSAIESLQPKSAIKVLDHSITLARNFFQALTVQDFH